MRALTRSDEAYRALFGSDDLALFVLGEGIEDCNEAACRLLGRPREALLGRSPLELSPPLQPDGAPSALAGQQRVQSALMGLPQWFQWQFLRGDGSPVEGLVHLEAVRLEGSRRLLVRVRDLSRLREAERALHDTEARLQQILDNTTAVVFAKDRRGRYLFANRELQRLAGKPAEAIVGRTDDEVWPPDMASRFRRNDEQVLRERRSIEFEETGVFHGRQRTYLSFKFPLLDAGGSPYAVCGIATDITGRKRMEEALRDAALAVSTAEGEAVFRELVRYLAAILDVDVAFIAAFHNGRNAMRTLAFWADGRLRDNIDYRLDGTPCALVVGREFRFFPDHLTELFPADDMLVRLGVCSYAAYPLNDAAGRPLGLVAAVARRPMGDREFIESVLKIFAARAAAEIERQRTEEARRRSEASYRSIFEASEDAIFIHDWDTGAIVDVNPRACRMYGYTRDQMLRLTVGDLSSGEHPYTQAEAGRWIAKAKQGERVRFEWHRRNSDGSLHWDEVILCKAEIAGKPHILAITREITERKEQEEDLRRSEERLRATIEAALDAVIGMDGAGRIVQFNAAAERCFGFRREEVLGKKLAETIIPERFRRAHQEGMERYRVSGTGPYLGRRVEVTAMRADGSEFPAELAVGVAPSRDGDIFIGYLRDITERKRAEVERGQLEAQLRQAQKMEAIGHLTGGIAHDFNNILTSVMGYIVLAGERPAVLEDQKLAKYLEQVHLSCTRARDLIQQMLTFSRGRRGAPRPLMLPLLVKESAKLLRSSLPATIELRAFLDEEVPAVMLDPVHVEQVLLNLCINARDAMEGSGEIRVAVRQTDARGTVCASCRQPVTGRLVELAVRDTGPGIPPEVMDRMFEPFFSTKEVGKGSGMGLATVHGIVHEYGGHVAVVTHPGLGTEFRVLFPPMAVGETAAAAGPASAAQSRLPRPALRGRVLVVEDEELVGEFMRELMEGWGLEVTVKTSGLEARDAFAEDVDRFDLVVTDQTMPRLPGLELAKILTRLRPGLPVILYTGYADALSEAEIQASGIRALMRKPVEPAELFSLLKAHLPHQVSPRS